MKIDLENIICIACNTNLEHKLVYMLNSDFYTYNSCSCGSVRLYNYKNLLYINFKDFDLRLGFSYYCVNEIDCDINSDLIKEILYSDARNLSKIYLEIVKIYNNLIFQ